MEDALINSLPREGKFWLAQAVAGIVISDGIVDESELEYIREIVVFLDEMEDVNTIIGMVKNKQRPTLRAVKLEGKLAARMLMYLATIVVSDDKLAPAEAEFFKYVGSKLGFDPSFSQEVLGWARDFMNANKKRKALLKRAERLASS